MQHCDVDLGRERDPGGGAATQKALSPKVLSLVLGMESNPEFEDCSPLSGV